VARIGGDEFVILVEDIKDDEDAAEIVERIQEILKVPFVLQGREVFAPASMVLYWASRVTITRRTPSRRRYRPLPGQDLGQGALRAVQT
jgi:GGDEF domain-containing protein